MKLFSKILCLGAVVLGLASCDRDYEMPPLSAPSYNGAAANANITQIRALGAAATQTNPVAINDELVVRARISGNDESGNVFKKIFIQDETGNLEMEVDQSNVFNDYPVGQEVFINLKGLNLSVYGGELQIGYPGANANRIPYEVFKSKVVKNGWADTTKLNVIETSSFATLKVDDIKTHNALVKLTNVHFENGGNATFAPATGYGTQNLVDAAGQKIVVRTSSYADFAGKTLPKGNGTVVGILGLFNGTYQLTIRKAGDVTDFNGSSVTPTPTPTPTPSGAVTIPYTEALTGSSLGKFTIEDKSIDGLKYVWQAQASYTKASAYVSSVRHATESWLLSPVIDVPAGSTANMSFEHVGRYFDGTPANFCTLWVRPEGGTWTQVTIPNYSDGSSWTNWETTTVALAPYAGKKIQFGFKYTSTETTAGTWELKNFKVQ